MRAHPGHSPRDTALSAALTRLAVSVGAAHHGTGRLPPDLARVAPELRRRLAESEAALERHWARRVLRSREPWATLRAFPYFSGYDALCATEADQIRARRRGPEVLINAGSGPLPVSAALLARHLRCPVVCLERDRTAGAVGAGVLTRLGVTATTLVRDAAEVPRFPGAVGLVAALVSSRERVLRAFLEAGVDLVAVRSAVGDRCLLYPELRPDPPGATFIGSSGVIRGVINTTLLFTGPTARRAGARRVPALVP